MWKIFFAMIFLKIFLPYILKDLDGSALALWQKWQREGFFEVVQFLEDSGIEYWIARDLVNQVHNGVIDDDMDHHDLDFHIHEDDKDTLREQLEKQGFLIEEEKRYKLQIRATDATIIEFVFLIDIDPRSDIYIQFSRRTCYISPKHLFGDKRVTIGDVEVPTPYPMDEYVECVCAKVDRESTGLPSLPETAA